MNGLFGNKNAAGKHNMLKHGANAAAILGTTTVGGAIGGAIGGRHEIATSRALYNTFAGLGAGRLANAQKSIIAARTIRAVKGGAMRGGAFGAGYVVGSAAGSAVGAAVKHVYDERHPVKAAIRDTKARARNTVSKVKSKL